jgi:predicted small lipoprotein YifL
MSRSTHRLAFVLLACLALASLTACGRKAPDPAEQLAQQADQMKKSAEEMSRQAQSLQESAQAEHEPVPPVSFKVLIGYLPESIDGLKRAQPRGETSTMGSWTHSQASTEYGEGAKSIDVEINDFAYITMLYAPYKMMLKMNYQRETTEGYERSASFSGYPGFEEWKADEKSGNATALVGDRFIVTVRTSGLPEGAAKRAMESIDLKKLAGESASQPG